MSQKQIVQLRQTLVLMPVTVQVQIGLKMSTHIEGHVPSWRLAVHPIMQDISPAQTLAQHLLKFLPEFTIQLQIPQDQNLRSRCSGIPSMESHAWHRVAYIKIHEMENCIMGYSSDLI